MSRTVVDLRRRSLVVGEELGTKSKVATVNAARAALASE